MWHRLYTILYENFATVFDDIVILAFSIILLCFPRISSLCAKKFHNRSIYIHLFCNSKNTQNICIMKIDKAFDKKNDFPPHRYSKNIPERRIVPV